MSAPYPNFDQNPPYPQMPGGAAGMPPYPPNNQQQWGNPNQGYNSGYPQQPPNVGFQIPQGPPPGAGYYPPPPAQSGYGYPSQPQGYDPSKPMNPPYMDPNDPNYVTGIGFDDKSIRAGFIRRVYSILSIQLLVTLGFIALFVFHGPTRKFAFENPGLLMIPAVGTIVLMCAMACFESARRNSPTNIILLGLFTFFESILVGFISCTYDTKIVFQAILLTTAIVIGLTIFAFQTKYDFTMCGGFLCIGLIVLTVGSIIGMFFFRGGLGQFIIACIGAGLFSMYIVYDTQLMMGGDHKYSISPEEYIFAALNLYMDIIQLFIYLLRILKYLNND